MALCVVTGVLLLLVGVAAGCGGTATVTTTSGGATVTTGATGSTGSTAAATGTPIKIGVLDPTTGAQTLNGTEVNTGIKLYFDSIGNQIAGHPVQLIYEDDASNPQQGLDRARKLVEQDKVDLLMGVVHSGVVAGVAQYAAQMKVPFIITCAGADAMTGAARSPYVFRTAETNSQRNQVNGWYAATKLGYKKAALFSWNFAAGQQQIAAFKKSFEAAGGAVTYSNETPLPTPDFGPYLSKVDKKNVDVIWAFYTSDDAIRFLQQLKQFGYTPGIPIVDQGSLTEDEILPQLGDNALGILGTTCYTSSLDNAVNKTFLGQYDKVASGKKPGWYSYQGYLGAMVAAASIQSLSGDLSNKDAFLKAIGDTKLDGPGGPFAFDDHGQAILNQYIVKVAKDSGGNLYHQVLETFSAVSQNWTPPAQ